MRTTSAVELFGAEHNFGQEAAFLRLCFLLLLKASAGAPFKTSPYHNSPNKLSKGKRKGYRKKYCSLHIQNVSYPILSPGYTPPPFNLAQSASDNVKCMCMLEPDFHIRSWKMTLAAIRDYNRTEPLDFKELPVYGDHNALVHILLAYNFSYILYIYKPSLKNRIKHQNI